LLGPHAPDTVSPEMLTECARAAEQLDTRMLIHLAQSRAEVNLARRRGFAGSIDQLARLGFLSPRVHAAHMVFAGADEVEQACASGMTMSFNPRSSLIWIGAPPPLAALLAGGIRVGIGTDACSMDQLDELRYAQYVGNQSEPGEGLAAERILRMATIDGATALGIGDVTGSIAVGKRADLVVLDLGTAATWPVTSYVEGAVLRAKAEAVKHVFVDGELVYSGGRLTRVDQEELVEEAGVALGRLLVAGRPILERHGVVRRLDAVKTFRSSAEVTR
jgi:5-methylthioadenosine/S-adenosylhomocysteine deaminase